jgi:PTS hybrid protein
MNFFMRGSFDADRTGCHFAAQHRPAGPECQAASHNPVRTDSRVPGRGDYHAGMAPVVGIVVVSHSERLAGGLVDLLRQLVGDRVPVEVAAGAEDGGIGTSDLLIRAAVLRADRGAGVAVLADLGSAVLTVLTVLADAEAGDADAGDADAGDADAGDADAAAVDGGGAGDRPAGGVVLVDAPLVEGAVAAAVTAGTGADLAAVVAAAEAARDFRKLP